ncbi:MAG: hypothetical protein ACP5T6_01415 [Candidatus Micrarchaeia archaeon]
MSRINDGLASKVEMHKMYEAYIQGLFSNEWKPLITKDITNEKKEELIKNIVEKSIIIIDEIGFDNFKKIVEKINKENILAKVINKRFDYIIKYLNNTETEIKDEDIKNINSILTGSTKPDYLIRDHKPKINQNKQIEPYLPSINNHL